MRKLKRKRIEKFIYKSNVLLNVTFPDEIEIEVEFENGGYYNYTASGYIGNQFLWIACDWIFDWKKEFRDEILYYMENTLSTPDERCAKCLLDQKEYFKKIIEGE